MNKPIAIIYGSRCPGPGRHEIRLQPGYGSIFIRTEVAPGIDLSERLAEAHPHEDEVVLNTIFCE